MNTQPVTVPKNNFIATKSSKSFLKALWLQALKSDNEQNWDSSFNRVAWITKGIGQLAIISACLCLYIFISSFLSETIFIDIDSKATPTQRVAGTAILYIPASLLAIGILSLILYFIYLFFKDIYLAVKSVKE